MKSMKVLSHFGQLVFLALTVVVVFALAYIVGFQYLIGDNLLGNDSYSFFSIVLWFDRYFPNIPFWYPLAGGGVSLVSGYPTFSAFMVCLVERVTSLDLVQSFRLLGFSSVPLTSIGVFALVASRFKVVKDWVSRSILALLAAIFVVISPASWLWLTRWGFYAESVSVIFIPWAILFFDYFISSVIQNKIDWRFRVSFLATVIFVYLAAITHFFAIASLSAFFILIFFFRFLLEKKHYPNLLSRVFKYFVLLVIGLVGILGYKLLVYKFYMSQVAWGGFAGYGRQVWESINNNTLPLDMMLSLRAPKSILETQAIIFDMRFPLYVWVLFVLGLVFSFKKSKSVFVFGLYGAIGLLLTSVMAIKYPLSQIPLVKFFVSLIQDRSYLIIARSIVPAIAAFGAWALWDTLLPNFRLKKPINLLLALISITVVIGISYNAPYKYPFIVGTGVGSQGIIDLRDIWQKNELTENYIYGDFIGERDLTFIATNKEYQNINFYYLKDVCLGIGPEFVDPGTVCSEYQSNQNLVLPSLEAVRLSLKACSENRWDTPRFYYCKSFFEVRPVFEQLKLSNWPKFKISSSVSEKKKDLEKIIGQLPNGEYRFDLSGYMGGAVMATPLVTSNSQIQLYINTTSLIYNSWNYQSQVMYSAMTSVQKPGVLTQLGKWFGLKYVYLSNSENEPREYWTTDPNWVNLSENWKEFSLDSSLATWQDKPKVLVVTDVKRGLYDQVFRLSTWGAIPYEEATLIVGKKSVDSYSLTELKKYDVILMRGYSYGNQARAYNLLDEYVKSGGILVFDTGWQWETPDYQLEKAPDFMPFDSLTWQNLNPNSSFVIEDQGLINSSESGIIMGDLKYEGSSWGVSVPGKLRSWAKTLVSFDNEPLVVSGSYGQGRVIWFGFNVVAHAMAKDAPGEAFLFNQILKQSLSQKTVQEKPIFYKRINPDEIEFQINSGYSGPSQIYFRESYFPYWKATLKTYQGDKKLSVEKAGPGFILINLPEVKTGDKVILEIKVPFLLTFLKIIGLGTIIMICLYIFKPEIFSWFKLPKIKFKSPILKMTNENEDY